LAERILIRLGDGEPVFQFDKPLNVVGVQIGIASESQVLRDPDLPLFKG
jgi:hypothetical protein